MAGGVLGPKQYGVAGAGRHELHASQDEGAHQDPADLRIDLHERSDFRALELHHFASDARANLKQRASPGNHVRFARELPGTVAHHQMLVVAFTLNDVQLTVDDDEAGDIGIARFDKHLAGFGRAADDRAPRCARFDRW